VEIQHPGPTSLLLHVYTCRLSAGILTEVNVTTLPIDFADQLALEVHGVGDVGESEDDDADLLASECQRQTFGSKLTSP
jgi:hypothetical protein